MLRSLATASNCMHYGLLRNCFAIQSKRMILLRSRINSFSTYIFAINNNITKVSKTRLKYGMLPSTSVINLQQQQLLLSHFSKNISERLLSSTVQPPNGSNEVTEDNEEKPKLGFGKYKTSTGLVGLAVEPDWYNVMLRKFQALLDKMEASDMPETAQYRIDVTKWCNYVIATVKANPTNPEAVEDAVQMGQVEELIEMADDEMICLDTYLSSRMWELVAQANPTVIDLNPDPMRDPFSADGNTAEQDAIRKGMETKTTSTTSK